DTYAEAHPASEFLSGVRASIPVIVAAAPFGVLFGALAVENGFSASEAMLMSAAIFGGASQMVGIDVFGARVAPSLIVFSRAAVTLHLELSSPPVGRYRARGRPLERVVGFFCLGRPQLAEAEQRVDAGRPLGFAWYMGVALPLHVFWSAQSALGAVFGRLIP